MFTWTTSKRVVFPKHARSRCKSAKVTPLTSKFSLDEDVLSYICIVPHPIMQFYTPSAFEICFDLHQSVVTKQHKSCSLSLFASCTCKPTTSQTPSTVRTAERSICAVLGFPTSEHHLILWVLLSALSSREPPSGVKWRNYLTHAAISMWPVTLGCWSWDTPWRRGFISPSHSSHTQRPLMTPRGNLKLPIYLMCMFLRLWADAGVTWTTRPAI